MGYVYKITNIITNKCYIGETIKNNPYLRWNEHKQKIEKELDVLLCKTQSKNMVLKILSI